MENLRDEILRLNLKSIIQTKEKLKDLGKKMSRNEPCHCGSGKKFKKCCGAL